MTPLRIQNVSKTYGDFRSVDDVSLMVNQGERVALLGQNGAGKTTLMRMILGLTKPSGGKLEVLGGGAGSRAARAQIGFLPESVAFHGALTGREQLRHFARLKSVSTKQADDLLERVGLYEAADRKIRTYSKGMRQRVGLAQALLGTPKLALLDEPTSGLDPISRHEFYDIVEELSQAGTAILLSSHALTELETRTDRIAIMNKGKLLADSSLRDLRDSARLPIRVDIFTIAHEADRVAAEIGGERINGRSVTLTCQQEDKLKLVSRISAFGPIIEDVEMTPASLEDLYRHYSLSAQEAS
ncbi:MULTISPECIES: ABC transporter ATP-binding protein [Halocynthiibacter]|uniref:ABC transporter ATP-binding protein n=1 Tax=Halocynthiibacter halioticoli TaxID=2986804 RepID=A0AAE3IYS1_9RHOB|nr:MULTISPECIES: ABC transporter ATP-binding protein [Halocynthiibacter]MCV6823416.1 ABC transporter ATP-binding protein [Halocynthiibacter halioticoli]MCW4056417.1 ABC transporter ATP-binding protein [Halocynthiibacter sp. SDUM655004]